MRTFCLLVVPASASKLRSSIGETYMRPNAWLSITAVPAVFHTRTSQAVGGGGGGAGVEDVRALRAGGLQQVQRFGAGGVDREDVGVVAAVPTTVMRSADLLQDVAGRPTPRCRRSRRRGGRARPIRR